MKPILLLTAILAVFLIASAAPSHADSGWETVKGTNGVNGGGEDFQTVCIKKIGSYYIKCVDNPNKEIIAFYYSKNEKTGYKQFLRQTDNYERLSGYFDVAVKGDSYICYIKDKIMMGRFGSSAKEVLYDHVGYQGKDNVISGAYGDHIFLNHEYRDGDEPHLLMDFNVSTRELKILKSGYLLTAIYKNTMLLEKTHSYNGDEYEYLDDTTTYIHTYSNGATKEVARLGKCINSWEAGFVGNKIYFVVYKWTKKGVRKTLKRCSLTGKGVKTLGKFKMTDAYYGMPISKLTSKYCIVDKDTKIYKYTYKKKKLKKIKKKQFKKEMANVFKAL